MLTELNETKSFLIEKFGSEENVKPGIYAVPTNTSKGPAFMKVVINEKQGMSDFSLWLDEDFTKSWHDKEKKIKCYTMKSNGSKLVDPEIDNILQTLKCELEENLKESDEPIKFVFHIEHYTQEELNKLGEFDGF